LAEQVADFEKAIKYANSVLENKTIAEFTPEELLNFLVRIHQWPCISLYQTLPKTKIPESPGEVSS